MTTHKFTEQDTENFYDQEDALYRSFWDEEGGLHWGYFNDLDNAQAKEFSVACKRWNDYMLQKSGINAQSRVLDIGCGNGNTAIWLAQKTGCEVIGLDISQVRIDNANQKAVKHPKLKLSFQKDSATDLPFTDNIFTHVWSQATLYHIHDRETALKEIYRVLREGGTFLFDDLVTPTTEVNELARQYVYERLLFSPSFSHQSYANYLKQLGFMVFEADNLNNHLQKSYELLSQLALPNSEKLSDAYIKMCESISQQQVGWSFYCCKKITDALSWIYTVDENHSLQEKYAAWANHYDEDLDEQYRISPIQSAQALAAFLPDKEVNILDVGAGTGMVGEALNKLGYNHLIALDFSAEMLAIAKNKQVYTTLHQLNLNQPITVFEQESFNAIIAVGIFTFEHANAEDIRHLFPLLKIGGFFALTVRADYLAENTVLQPIIKELPWELVNQTEFNIFSTEKMYSMVFKKKES